MQRRRFSSRSFRRPKPKGSWVTLVNNAVTSAVGATVNLLADFSAAAQQNTLGAPEKLVIRYWQMSVVTTTPPAANTLFRYVLIVDPTATGPLFFDPNVLTTYQNHRILHTGQLYTGPVANVPLFNGYQDGIRSGKTRMRTDTDEGLYLGLMGGPVGTIFSIVTRVYLQRLT